MITYLRWQIVVHNTTMAIYLALRRPLEMCKSIVSVTVAIEGSYMWQAGGFLKL